MRSRLLATAALATALTGLGAAPALASGASDPYDCSDFEYQEDAQAVYDQDPTDPSRLDEDSGTDDGVACETLPSRSGGTVTSTGDEDEDGDGDEDGDDDMTMPSGGADTGAGGAAGGTDLGLLGGGVALVAVGAGAYGVRRYVVSQRG